MDLVGQIFNELKVIKFNEIIKTGKSTERSWLCICSCGECTTATTRQLNKGRKKSCGHLNTSRKKEQHNYKIKDDYAIVYTHKGEEFWVDIDDLEKVLLRTWHFHHTGYVVSKINNKQVRLHRYLTNPPEGMDVDHKNHLLHDNRQNNLRVCEHADNGKNLAIAKNNTSGTTGVCFGKSIGKWQAYIRVKEERIHLGVFSEKEQAIKARMEAEERYFGEFRNISGL